MRRLPLLVVAALVGCGGPGSQNADAPGQVSTQAAATPSAALAPPAASPTSPWVKPSKPMTCEGLPDFAILAPDAAIDFCFVSQASPTFGGGNVNYMTKLSPDAVIALYRNKAKSSGMADTPLTDKPGATYAANDATKRTISVVIKPDSDGQTEVRLKWEMND